MGPTYASRNVTKPFDRRRRSSISIAGIALACVLGRGARAQSTVIAMPALDVEATAPLALDRLEMDASCRRLPRSTTIECTLFARHRLENTSTTVSHARFASDEGALVACGSRSSTSCDDATIDPGESLEVRVRSSHRLDLVFERRWTRDGRLALGHPHASPPPGAARHPLVGSDRGPGDLASIRIVVPRPTGASSDSEAPIPIRFAGDFTTTDYDSLSFGENELILVDGSIRAGILGGPTFFLGGELRSGFGGRVGYEIGFGRLPLTFDLSFEGARRRGPGASGTLFVFTPTGPGIGAGLGVGPALRVDRDGTHLGARLTLDVTLVVALRATLTFEPGEPTSFGLYAGGSL